MINSAYINYSLKKFKEYLAVKTEMVQHREVIREVASSVDRTWIYYVTLMVAGLIALLGLLTNSVAVVIGAMLISPLMGPIISSSLAFTIGDLPLARRAFQTIAVSVALTILVSAIVSFISPLKEPTAEILSRVRPNIFDLFVAVLSGIVGAIALCTKRNYLITSTGVAVATAVIPPLSVTGYGLGTGQPWLALGGFLLFFTNFVAIVLASDVVFFIMGFRNSHVETVQYSRRTRYLIVGGLLALVSVPLVYTLASDVGRIKDKKRIERVLKRHLDKEQVSRLTSYSHLPKDGKVLVKASVNTLQFIEDPSQLLIEEELAEWLKRPVHIELEQLIVASGKELKPTDQAKQAALAGVAVAVKQETPAEINGKVGGIVAQVERELAAALAPFPLSNTRLTFAGASEPLLVSATLRRDYPVSDDELLILSRQVGRVLEMPVALNVEAVPLLPVLRVDKDGNLAAESISDLDIVNRLPDGPGRFRFQISSLRRNEGEAEALRQYLTRELAVPDRQLSLVQVSGTTAPAGVTLRILRQGNSR